MGASFGLFHKFDVAPMRARILTRDGQPQTGPFDMTFRRPSPLIKRVEYLIAVRFVDTRACIRHIQLSPLAVLGRLDTDTASGRRKFHSI